MCNIACQHVWLQVVKIVQVVWRLVVPKLVSFMIMITCSNCSMVVWVWNSDLCCTVTVLMAYRYGKVVMKLHTQMQLNQLGLESALKGVQKVRGSVCSVVKFLWVVHSIVQGVMILFLVSLVEMIWNRIISSWMCKFWGWKHLWNVVKEGNLILLDCCSLRVSVSMMNSLISRIVPHWEVVMMQMHSQI